MVRAQTLIKLYIIYNMLEVRIGASITQIQCDNIVIYQQVADRLFSSFGQDILDALFWTATESTQDNFVKILFHTALAIIYVCILFTKSLYLCY